MQLKLRQLSTIKIQHWVMKTKRNSGWFKIPRFLARWFCQRHMKTRKAQALVGCNKLGKIWKSNLCRELKVSVFLATVESVFLYGSETWTLTKSTEKQIDGAYTRMLRTALNVSWRDHITNSDQHQFSPNDIHTLSWGEVMRIKKMII